MNDLASRLSQLVRAVDLSMDGSQPSHWIDPTREY